MTPEILDLTEESRNSKNTQQYKQLDKEIRNKCLKAKESFYSRQCDRGAGQARKIQSTGDV